MISKLSAHAPDRPQAIARMLRALDEYEIAGCHTTIPFCEFVLNHKAFIEAEYDTHFVKDHFETRENTTERTSEHIVALAAALLKDYQTDESRPAAPAEKTKDALYTNWWKNRR